MAISPLGQSFSPTAATDDERKKPNPAQQAIQVLSMRLPRVKGARAISPLLGERPGGGGNTADLAVLQSVLQSATGGSAEAGPFGALGATSMPGSFSDGTSAPFSGSMPGAGASEAGELSRMAERERQQPPRAPVVTPGIEDPNRTLPPILPGPEPKGPMPKAMPKPMPKPDPQIPLGPDDLPGGVTASAPSPAAPSSPGADPRMVEALRQLFGLGREF